VQDGGRGRAARQRRTRDSQGGDGGDDGQRGHAGRDVPLAGRHGNQVLLFVGMRLSERPPDRAHPFGHGMNTYFWAFVVSAMLFTLGGAVAIWEAVHKFIRPSATAASPAAFFVLAGAFVFESMSLGVPLHSART